MRKIREKEMAMKCLEEAVKTRILENLKNALVLAKHTGLAVTETELVGSAQVEIA